MAFAEWALHATASIQFIHHQKFKKLAFLYLVFLPYLPLNFISIATITSAALCFTVYSSFHVNVFSSLHFFALLFVSCLQKSLSIICIANKSEMFRGFCASVLCAVIFSLSSLSLSVSLAIYLFIGNVQHTTRFYK